MSVDLCTSALPDARAVLATRDVLMLSLGGSERGKGRPGFHSAGESQGHSVREMSYPGGEGLTDVYRRFQLETVLTALKEHVLHDFSLRGGCEAMCAGTPRLRTPGFGRSGGVVGQIG